MGLPSSLWLQISLRQSPFTLSPLVRVKSARTTVGKASKNLTVTARPRSGLYASCCKRAALCTHVFIGWLRCLAVAARDGCKNSFQTCPSDVAELDAHSARSSLHNVPTYTTHAPQPSSFRHTQRTSQDSARKHANTGFTSSHGLNDERAQRVEQLRAGKHVHHTISARSCKPHCSRKAHETHL